MVNGNPQNKWNKDNKIRKTQTQMADGSFQESEAAFAQQKLTSSCPTDDENGFSPVDGLVRPPEPPTVSFCP